MQIGERYTLDREIGRGGMGAVWSGHDAVLSRVVAIKRIGLMPGADTPDRLRAEREARIAAGISHPNVVGVFDLVHAAGEQWLVMEYVQGETLAARIRREGPLPPAETAAVLGQAAKALFAAHQAGVIHRDVKPSNILINEAGTAKLSDFGIARVSNEEALTQSGVVTGSPGYLAPEIASGHPATAASDVWSLGATAYHALTGHPPYEVTDNNVLGTLYRIVHDEPPQVADAGWLAPFLAGTMTKDPAQRWTMREAERFLATGALPAAAESTSSSDGNGNRPPSGAPAAAAPGARRRVGSQPSRGGLRLVPWLLLVAVFAVLLVATIAIVTDDGPQDPQAATVTERGSESPSPSPSEPESSPTEKAGPTGKQIEDFISGYLQEASTNPQAAFASLTPGFQAASPQYEEFWGNVQEPRVTSITPDPENLTVNYTYAYFDVKAQQEREDTVQLQLEYDKANDRLLIAGEA